MKPIKSPLVLVASLLLAFSLKVQAQTFTIDVDQLETFTANTFIGSNITHADGPDIGLPAFGGEGILLCFNRRRINPSIDSTHTYEVKATSYFFKDGGDVMGLAMVHWLIDNYYHPMMTDEDYSDRYALHLALWEIVHDFDGTLASMGMYDGSHHIDGEAGGRPEWDHVGEDLIANYAGISADYRSSLYTITLLEDLDTDYQSMLLVTPAPVPEPSGALLIVLSSTVALLGRSRRF